MGFVRTGSGSPSRKKPLQVHRHVGRRHQLAHNMDAAELTPHQHEVLTRDFVNKHVASHWKGKALRCAPTIRVLKQQPLTSDGVRLSMLSRSNRNRHGKCSGSGEFEMSMMSLVSGSRQVSTAGSCRRAASKTLLLGTRIRVAFRGARIRAMAGVDDRGQLAWAFGRRVPAS